MKKNFFEMYELDDVTTMLDESSMNESELAKMKNLENLSDEEVNELPSYDKVFFVNKNNVMDEVVITLYGEAAKMVENEWDSSNPIEDTELLIKSNFNTWEKNKMAEFEM